MRPREHDLVEAPLAQARIAVAPAAADVTDMAMGWHWYLDKLDAEVSGRPQPTADWDTFTAEVGPAYRPA